MTYDEFEYIGMRLGVPYGLCKMAWTMFPFKEKSLDGKGIEGVRIFFRSVLDKLPIEALDRVKFLSSFEVEEGTWESIAKRMIAEFGKPSEKDPYWEPKP